MSYVNAPQTKFLATNCIVCGRPLVDAISVELGIGPDCRKGYDANINSDTQDQCNELTLKAALAAQDGYIPEVNRIAQEIEDLGLKNLANKIRRRFVNAKRNAKVIISMSSDNKYYIVKTPYVRSRKEEFVTAWRAIKGRFYKRKNKQNYVPVERRAELWALLQEFFEGQYGLGPLGVFRIKAPDS